MYIRIKKEVVVGNMKVIPRHSPGETEERKIAPARSPHYKDRTVQNARSVMIAVLFHGF
jgi:hypothetical protein